MAWIESHQELLRHKKTQRLARLLRIKVPHVIGHLHCLWYWALDFAEEGKLTGCDAFDIAQAAMWDGEPEQFVAAMVGAGFLDQGDDGVLAIHDWWEYAGKLIERRKADRERKRKSATRSSSGIPAELQRNSTEVARTPADSVVTVTVTPTVTPTEPAPPIEDPVPTIEKPTIVLLPAVAAAEPAAPQQQDEFDDPLGQDALVATLRQLPRWPVRHAPPGDHALIRNLITRHGAPMVLQGLMSFHYYLGSAKGREAMPGPGAVVNWLMNERRPAWESGQPQGKQQPRVKEREPSQWDQRVTPAAELNALVERYVTPAERELVGVAG